jgi:hypothetical protein
LQEDFKQLADAFGESPQCTPDQLFSCLTGFMDAYEVHSSRTLAAPIDYQCCVHLYQSRIHQRAEKDMRMKEEKAIKMAAAASTQPLP